MQEGSLAERDRAGRSYDGRAPGPPVSKFSALRTAADKQHEQEPKRAAFEEELQIRFDGSLALFQGKRNQGFYELDVQVD